jgi:hypothetical protein
VQTLPRAPETPTGVPCNTDAAVRAALVHRLEVAGYTVVVYEDDTLVDPGRSGERAPRRRRNAVDDEGWAYFDAALAWLAATGD